MILLLLVYSDDKEFNSLFKVAANIAFRPSSIVVFTVSKY